MPLGRRRRRRGRTTQQQRPPAAGPAAGAGSPPSSVGLSPRPRSSLTSRPVGGQVTVKKALLVARLTCPLCLGLLQDAATIPECLHTFCSKCITKRLVDDEEERCPVCKKDLGCSAADKLRSDHHLQYLRDKLFPIKRKRTQLERGTPNSVPPIQIQTQKVKERSLSSLVAAAAAHSKTSKRLFDATDECSSPSLVGNARKKTKHTQLKEEKIVGPPEEPAMVTYTRRQVSPDVDGSSSHSQQREGGNKKGSNSIKPENSIPAIKIKTGSVAPPNGHKLKLSSCTSEGKDNVKKLRRRRKGSSRKENISAQDSLTSKPIWFSLIASSNPEGGAVLPQLTANFLRIKDGEMNVSSIQKYVKNKLGLGAQTEVEIVCRGQAMNPDMTVHGLMNMWIRNESSHKVNSTVGASAKDFVMVLSYHLKFQSQI